MMLGNEYIQGKERRYYSVRLIAIVIAISLFTSAVTGFVVTLVTTSSVKSTLYASAVQACGRGNQVRTESNKRISDHELDRDNLGKLAAALSRNRAAEASGFAAIGGAFGIESKIDPLVSLLRRASRIDQTVADSQKTVTFSPLSIIDCHDTKIVPKP